MPVPPVPSTAPPRPAMTAPAAATRSPAPAAALAALAVLSAAPAVSADPAGPNAYADRGLLPGLGGDPAYLQAAEPGESDVGTDPVDYREPSWYAKGGLMITFPRDLSFDQEFVVETDPDPDVIGDELIESVVQARDETLGWGGGLYVGLGYEFNPGGRISPRVEGEYQLLIADFRGADDLGSTWNALGVNVLLDFQLIENQLDVYGGLGAGATYASFSTPGLGSDDDFSYFVQAMGGFLVRFDRDVDIDFGLRYTYSQLDLYDGTTDLDNVTFHVGLLLHLE